MSDRVALVTGAGRGIGRATARRLAGSGLRVMALDWCAGNTAGVPYAQSTREDLARLEEELGDRVMTRVVDVRDRAALDAAVASALERWGRLDEAVAAASVLLGGRPLWETPAQESALLWDVDVVGVWNTAAAVVPAMLAGPDPSGCPFVAVPSAAGERGLHRLAAYTTAKHAVIGLVRGLAADLVGTGVAAVAVSPGSTRTDMLSATADLYGLASSEELARHQGLQRLLTPDEVAATVAFCCSPEAAALHGSVVNADGGFAG